MGVIEFPNQDPAIKIRDHVDIAGTPVLLEPCRIFFR
jgi:hypothetical protein